MGQAVLAKLDKILSKAANEEPLTRPEIARLLDLNDERQMDRVFATARFLRTKYFGSKVFLYGFVYFSTWCRNDCTFCYYRKSNSRSTRYRKNNREILETVASLAESGVHLIDLTMGEDPLYHLRQDGYEALADLVREVKSTGGLPVMVSPGVVPEPVLQAFAAAGADWYACYQETHNPELFARLRIQQNYEQRLASKKQAVQHGLLIEEGILAGVGESTADLLDSLENMRLLKAHQVRVMSFVPQEGSAMANWPTPERAREMKIIAVLRLLFPDRLIPASLDIDGLEGLQARLVAGANVITSIIPSQMGLAGVAQSTKDIAEGYRTVKGVVPLLEQINMEAATAAEYLHWVATERGKIFA